MENKPVRQSRTQVLIVGSGPIGLSLAADLGKRGINVVLVEKRHPRVGPAKMNLVSVRTMEFCRWLGIAPKIRDWGFPLDFCLDNIFVAGSLNGWELARVPMPPMGGPAHSTFSPERQRKCPQTIFDPVMRECAAGFPTVDLRYRKRFESFTQDENGVTALIADADTGEREMLRADYLIGTDGYESVVREQLGITSRGVPKLDVSLNVEFDVEGVGHFSELHELGNGSRYAVVGPNGLWATLIPLDGYNFWRATFYGANDIDVDAIDIDKSLTDMIGRPFQYKIRSVIKWTRRLMIADRFQDGRVFLAGDAAHTLPPNGGLGMNTGIADVFNLGWKLAAVLHGWAHPNLLSSYDVERRPVCLRTGNETLTNYGRLTGNTAYPHIAAEGPDGDRSRRELGERLKQENTKAWHPVGIHLGYVYDPSPAIVHDGTARLSDDVVGYQPGSRPGMRAPHFWIEPDKSVLDLFGPGLTLLSFGGTPVDPFVAAAGQMGVPLCVRRIDSDEGRQLYENHDLVLVRPDGHIAWRGKGLPQDVRYVLDRVRGVWTASAHWAHDAKGLASQALGARTAAA